MVSNRTGRYGRVRRSTRSPMLPGHGPLSGIRPLAAFLIVLAMFGVGVWLGGPIGTGLLALLSVGVVLLLIATWPVLRPSARILRVLVVILLAVIAVSRYR